MCNDFLYFVLTMENQITPCSPDDLLEDIHTFKTSSAKIKKEVPFIIEKEPGCSMFSKKNYNLPTKQDEFELDIREDSIQKLSLIPYKPDCVNLLPNAARKLVASTPGIRQGQHDMEANMHFTENGIDNKQEVLNTDEEGTSTNMISCDQQSDLCCEICGERFLVVSVLQMHMKMHTGEHAYEYTQCGKQLANSKSLKEHKSEIHEGKYKSAPCEACGKIFDSKSSLSKHMITHTGEKPYKCDCCGKGFTQTSSLNVHMRIHTGEKPYGCGECGKHFRSSSYLNTHIKKHTAPMVQKTHECDWCGRTFATNSDLTIHSRQHTGEKPFICKKCGKAFGDPSVLRRHLIVHIGQKNYKCQHCSKSFVCQSRLNTHLLVHSEKPVICTDCGKTLLRSSLRDHMKLHSEANPFTCKTCGKRFSRRDPFNDHVRSHTGEKVHKCITCGKYYSSKRELAQHMKIHNEEQPYECPTCGRCFIYSSRLNKHMKIHIWD